MLYIKWCLSMPRELPQEKVNLHAISKRDLILLHSHIKPELMKEWLTSQMFQQSLGIDWELLKASL